MTKRDGAQAEWRRHFWAPTLTWFDAAFAGPTPAQIATWTALEQPGGALVIAPTGSGKTLAAFLLSIDRLARSSPPRRPSVLYVSPLKALAVDIERNLAQPLAGIRQAADEMGLAMPDIRVGLRSGDTPPTERRRLVINPPDILITTPESLFLMLSSKAAETLNGIETVIVDEIHSLAGTKRGAHLAVSLERLDARLRAAGRPAMRRIGLSATVRPAEAVAAFLGGGPVTIIEPRSPKEWVLDVRVPVEDMAALPPPPRQPESANRSIWPFIDEAIFDLVMAHRSTICFVNSRMVAERLTANLNQLAGDDTIVARAHHGSLSKEHRAVVEEDLKAGRLRCVVATSSLELGIDMGFVDLVIQTGSPPSVASGLQRVGRAGHQVGTTSHGVVFPTSRPDLVEAAVVTNRMADGLIEAVPTLANPLDVLAQQVVSMCLDAHPTPDEVFGIVRGAQPFANLPRAGFDAVLEMLAGRYPSESFGGLRARLAIGDSGRLAALPGSRQLTTVSGGTIPDRGLYGVFLVGGDEQRHDARRVGELDEEMVNETRLGDVITLGSSSWRVVAITPHQVQVIPAQGLAGRLPFWHGDSIGRPAELGKAIGAFIQSVGDSPTEAAKRLAADGLDA
ncbi:MAG: DEAD/DEAH box helicase, partial [Propionibacteriaceae bacterium]|nr:DEAD/DEAH box helicase [Propionibacteriaceae bacterium]